MEVYGYLAIIVLTLTITVEAAGMKVKLVKENGIVSLPCPGISEDFDTRQWYQGYVNDTVKPTVKQGMLLFEQTNDGNITQHPAAREDMEVHTDTFTLTIKQAQLEDNTTFTCHINHTQGHVYGYIKLIVYDLLVRPNGGISLPCRALANGTMISRDWSRNLTNTLLFYQNTSSHLDRRPAAREDMSVEEEDFDLIIEHAQYEDNAVFTCSIEAEGGTDNGYIRLTVYGDPVLEVEGFVAIGAAVIGLVLSALLLFLLPTYLLNTWTSSPDHQRVALPSGTQLPVITVQPSSKGHGLGKSLPDSLNKNILKHQIKISELNFISNLSTGTFFSVDSYQCSIQGEVVVKSSLIRSLESYESLLLEGAIGMEFCNNRIMSPLSACIDKGVVRLVFPFLKHGDLSTLLQRYPNNYQHEHLAHYATDIAEGMAVIAERRIVHRNLALRNILVKADGGVCIGDFCQAQELGEENEIIIPCDTNRPIKWLAPESYNHNQYSFNSDMWSFGITMWEIFHYGSEPFNNVSQTELNKIVSKGQQPGKTDRCPQSIHQLMMACCVFNPAERLSFEQVVERLALIIETQDYNIGGDYVNVGEDSGPLY